MKHQSLTEGKIFPTLLEFAFPFLLASLLQAFYGATDLFVVGQFSDASVVSAVAIGSQVMLTVTWAVMGITTGGTVLIGQYFGAKREKDIIETVGTLICFFGVLALVLTIIMTLLTDGIVRLMQTPQEAVKSTIHYLFICSCGIPFITGYNLVGGILRGLGDSRTPVIFIAIACIINIIGNYILVGLFSMGAAGSAMATITAQALSLFIAIYLLKRKGLGFKFTRKDIRLSMGKVKSILSLGMPIALQDGLINVSFLIITMITNSMGVTVSAAVGVVEKIIGFAMLPPSAFGAAIAVLTAQNIGAKKPGRAMKSLLMGIGCSLIFGIASCIYSQINPQSVTALFTNDVQVSKAAALYLKSFSIDCILVCFIFCLNAFFTGSGYTVFPMVHSLIATVAVRIPVTLFLSKLKGVSLYEIGFAAPLASLLSIILCLIYLKMGRWKENRLVGEHSVAV